MKIYILTVTLLAAFASACTVNMGTPANNGVSNSNSPTNNNTAVKTEKPPSADAPKKENETSTKTEKPTDAGQKPERVEFASGKTETHLKRTIPANGSVEFVFGARSGQRLEFSAIYDGGSDTDIEAFLTEPGLQDISASGSANEPIEFMTKKSGDYRITVNNKTGNKVSIDFGLFIK